MKHTLGPWKVRKTNDGIYLIESEERYPIVGEYGWYGNKNTITANAHLIAAAPELLEACKDLAHQLAILNKKFLNKNDKYSALQTGVVQSYNKAIKAITKAEGGVK